MSNIICECGNLFAPSRGGNSSKMCKSCVSNRRRHQTKLKCIEYLGNKCSTCGIQGCPEIYDFHHREPKLKSFTISGKMSRSWEVLKEELDKCTLLCANCHRTLHFNEKMAKQYLFSYEQVKIPNKRIEARKTKKYQRSQKIIEHFGQPIELSNKSGELYSWPSVELVIDLVKETSFKRASEILGVSDNSIRKFLQRNNIDPKSVRSIKDNKFV